MNTSLGDPEMLTFHVVATEHNPLECCVSQIQAVGLTERGEGLSPDTPGQEPVGNLTCAQTRALWSVRWHPPACRYARAERSLRPARTTAPQAYRGTCVLFEEWQNDWSCTRSETAPRAPQHECLDFYSFYFGPTVPK